MITWRSAGVAPEVNLRNSTQARKQASDIHLGFEVQGRRHQKFKTGVSKRTYVLNFFKETHHKNDLKVLWYFNTRHSTELDIKVYKEDSTHRPLRTKLSWAVKYFIPAS